MSDHAVYRAESISKTQNEPTLSDLLDTFLKENPSTGAVVFEVHYDNPVRGRIPIANAKVTISKLLGNDYYLSKIEKTNENGETDPVRLPTVSREYSLKPGEVDVSSAYRASVEAQGYQRQDIYSINIYDGITTIQHVNLLPGTGSAAPRPTVPSTPAKPAPATPPAPTTPARPTTPTTPAAPARPTGPAASMYEKGY